MPYIGKEPVAGNFVLLDSITTSATATYALTKDSVAYSPESARNMIVSLNGVTQAPETAFTVSGSNITFSSALTASDVIDYILVLGDVLSVGTPSDGTVGTSQMSYPLGNFSSTGIDDNATSTAITIDSSENVGIGTTTPVSLGAGYKNLDIRHTTGGGVTLGDTSNIHGYLFSDNDGLTLQAPGSRTLEFMTGSTERMRIDSSGRVGIGTTSPDSKLQITTGTNNIIQHRDATHSTLTNVTSAITFSRTDGIDDLSAIMGWNDGGIALSGREGIAFATGGGVGYSSTVERMRIDSSGNVGIGTTNPQEKLHVASDDGRIAVQSSNGNTIDAIMGGYVIYSGDGSGPGAGNRAGIQSFIRDSFGVKYDLRFYTSNGSTNFNEVGRFTEDGHLLVGTTVLTDISSSGTGNEGAYIRGDGQVGLAISNDTVAIFNRKTSDGTILEFRKDGTTVGSIRSVSGGLRVDGQNGALYFNQGNTGGIVFLNSGGSVQPRITPDTDNLVDLGDSSSRFDDIYATNGTIQTSDANEKQDIEALSEAETRVAVAAKALLRKFRWKSAVEEKGDEARIHFGIIAQDLKAAFEAEGLDAGRYAMFIHSTWTDEETGEERSRMGVRYSELLAFIIAAI